MPEVNGVLETALYVDDIERSAGFYQSVFGFEVIERGERLWALSVRGEQVLLVCKKGASVDHDGSGRLHLAFSTSTAELEQWERWLTQKGIAIENRVNWERGGRSIYFRDPDHHLVELATPGTWSIY